MKALYKLVTAFLTLLTIHVNAQQLPITLNVVDADETDKVNNLKYTKIYPNKNCLDRPLYILNTIKTVEDCYDWAKKADPTARYFTFRTSGNYHCSPCGKSYEGTLLTGLADSDMDVYDTKVYKYGKNCRTWNDGCNSCNVFNDEIITCTDFICTSYTTSKCVLYKAAPFKYL